MPPTPQRTPRIPDSPKRGVKLERTDSLLQSKVLYTSPAALNHNDIAPQFNFDGHFKDWHRVGVGSFGEVYKAQSVQTGKWFAIKRSRKAFNGRWERERYLQEITTVCSLGEHANIVKYYRAWQENQHFYLQLELCEGGNLQNLLDFQEELMGPDTMKQFWLQMSSGLAHIHAHDMLHLDLKPENIFIVGDDKVGRTLKIGDFGTAVTLGQWDDEDGDPMYLAPELLRGEAGPPADVFSLGLIFYEMLTGCEMPNGGEEWQRLRHGQVELPETALDWQRVILQMIDPEPRNRPQAREVYCSLQSGLPLEQCKMEPPFFAPHLSSPAPKVCSIEGVDFLGGTSAVERSERFNKSEVDELNEGFSRSMSLSPLRGGFTSDDEL